MSRMKSDPSLHCLELEIFVNSTIFCLFVNFVHFYLNDDVYLASLVIDKEYGDGPDL